MSEIENIRKSFEPGEIRLLMIAESPPSNGAFFYKGDDLCKFTLSAFENAFETKFDSTTSFLSTFQKNGIFLEDLCVEPVNNLPEMERISKREEGIPILAEKLNIWKPSIIICMLKMIRSDVLEAIKISSLLDFEFYTVPYPRQRHIPAYIKRLTECLKKCNLTFNNINK